MICRTKQIHWVILGVIPLLLCQCMRDKGCWRKCLGLRMFTIVQMNSLTAFCGMCCSEIFRIIHCSFITSGNWPWGCDKERLWLLWWEQPGLYQRGLPAGSSRLHGWPLHRWRCTFFYSLFAQHDFFKIKKLQYMHLMEVSPMPVVFMPKNTFYSQGYDRECQLPLFWIESALTTYLSLPQYITLCYINLLLISTN